MQLVSRYLVSNKSVVVIDDTGNLTEYRKVYQRNIKIAKGIDNVITFEIKNHEQKPVSILNTYTPYVEVFTEDNVLLKRYVGTIKETSTPNFKGHFTINVTDGDTLNLDAQYNRVYTVVVEGPFDAIAVEGVALLGNEIKEQQALQINSLNTKVIVVPDRDEAGQHILNQAIDLGWGVSMPAWDDDIKDVNEAVQRYGKLYTLHTIVGSAEFSELKIKLGAKKWFNFLSISSFFAPILMRQLTGISRG